MSCDSLNQQPVRTTFSMGALPEGFCPVSMQELGEAIVARIISSTGQQFTTFVVGPNAPTSNVGPWLKNCEEWFVWDDATSSYVPIAKTGFNQEQYFAASGTFTVPDFIYRVRVSIWGAGGGGGGGGTVKSGGGGGGFVRGILSVVPGAAVPVVIGTGGSGTAAGVGAAGGNSTFMTLTAGGGGPGNGSTSQGAGGTAAGGTLNIPGQSGEIAIAAGESSGNGGDSPQGGGGGTVPSTVGGTAFANGKAPGGGGSGSDNGGAYAVGNGANGGMLIEW